MIAAGCVFGIILGMILVVFAVPRYRVEMVLAPAQGLGSDDSSASLNRNLRAADTIDSDFGDFQQKLTGPEVVGLLINDADFIKLMNTDRVFKRRNVRKASGDETAIAQDWFDHAVKIRHVGESPLRAARITHPDPRVAAVILRKAAIAADEMIRKERIDLSERRITYLQGMLTDAINPDHKKALADLLMEQERLRMAARMDTNFAFRMVRPPTAELRAVWPRPKLLIPALAMAGAFAGWILAQILFGFRARDPV